jgi:hypothetical protein
MDLHCLLREWDCFFLYVADIRISQKTHLWTSTAYYGDSFASLCVDDVRTSQKHAYGPPRLVTGIAFFSYM